MISYEGFDEAVLIHALYQGAHRPGMGDHWTPAAVIDIGHSVGPGLSVDDVRAEFADRLTDECISIDYYRGRPLKVLLDTRTKTFEERLFDRDAGQGAAQQVVDQLRSRAA